MKIVAQLAYSQADLLAMAAPQACRQCQNVQVQETAGVQRFSCCKQVVLHDCLYFKQRVDVCAAEENA